MVKKTESAEQKPHGEVVVAVDVVLVVEEVEVLVDDDVDVLLDIDVGVKDEAVEVDGVDEFMPHPPP